MQPHIPKEVYLDFLGWTIPVHWNYHAFLMVGVWFVLVPICIIVIRFGKPKPTLTGIHVKVSIRNPEWWWFSVHKYGLMFSIGLALAGAIVAVTVSGGFSGSFHSFFGLTTVTLGCLQIMGGWLRGKHGGKNYYTAKPNDPENLVRRSLQHDDAPACIRGLSQDRGLFRLLLRRRRDRQRSDAISDTGAGANSSSPWCSSPSLCPSCWNTRATAMTATAPRTATRWTLLSTKRAKNCSNVRSHHLRPALRLS